MSARVIVHSPAHAKAALAAAAALDKPVTLQSAPGAAAGPRWFLALVAEAARERPEAQYEAVLDCGDEAGTVLGALRAGLKRVIFTGAAEARQKLAEIGAQQGAMIEDGEDNDLLDLFGVRDAEAACRAFLASG